MSRRDLDVLDYWRLCDELNVIQAAMLIAGEDPSGGSGSAKDGNLQTRPTGYEAAETAISNALRLGSIKGRLIYLFEDPRDDDSIDLSNSRVDVESLRSWLASRGVRTGFFFPNPTDAPDYLDPNHPRYAPKLAAAVHAWLATGDESAIRGKSPKQALVKWLRENAARFGLADDDGKPNETGVEETAKVANWQPSGGAPKTPTG
jgi:hypothetical protein